MRTRRPVTEAIMMMASLAALGMAPFPMSRRRDPDEPGEPGEPGEPNQSDQPGGVEVVDTKTGEVIAVIPRDHELVKDLAEPATDITIGTDDEHDKEIENAVAPVVNIRSIGHNPQPQVQPYHRKAEITPHPVMVTQARHGISGSKIFQSSRAARKRRR